MMRIIYRCPHCQHVNSRCIEQFMGMQLVYCDVENGGCDGAIMLKWECKASIQAAPVDFAGAPVVASLTQEEADKALYGQDEGIEGQ